jgi:pimeloyl-ACP methyl ester carboxylesterase
MNIETNQQPDRHDYTPVFEPAECPFTLPQGFVEGEDVGCGFLQVPEDRSDPESTTIQLAAAIFRSPTVNEDSSPVIYIEGGPGVSALESLQFTIGKFAPLLQNHDLIFYDQRGVGFSQPALECPEHTSFAAESLEKHLTPEETRAQLMAVFAGCHQRLVEAGIDLSMYNTLQSAADLEDLRRALEIERWNLYSISYGTRVALETMRQYPDGIRSVILDSAVPPDADPIAEAPANVGYALETLFATCKSDIECDQAFPELEATLYDLAAKLDDQPIRVPVANLLTGAQYNSVVDGSVFLGIVIQSLYSAEVIPLIPMMIAETTQGNYAKLSSLRSSFLTSAGFISQGMYYTVRCHEEVPFANPEKISASLEQFPSLEKFFSASLGNSEAAFTFCTQWDAGSAPPEQNQAVASSIPALVLAGEYDPSTPVYWSRQVADGLEKGFYLEFPAVGHGPSLSHPCPNSVALAFLTNPALEPDSSCLSSMEITFMLPASLTDLEFVPAEVPEYNIRAAVPAGWMAVRPEYYVSPDQTAELVISENRSETPEAFLAKWGAGEVIDSPTHNQISWEVHSLSLPDKKVAGFTAISDSAQGFYFVLIIGAEDKQDSLYENVFAHVLEAYTLSNE